MHRTVPALLLPLLGGCSPEVDLGRLSGVLWSTSHEGGTIATWNEDGDGHVYLDGNGASADIVSDPVHTGQYAAALTIDPLDGKNSQAVLTRDTSEGPDLYFSAWFFVPLEMVEVNFWTILKVRSAGKPCPVAWGADDWDVFLSKRDGALYAGLYRHDPASVPAQSATPFPIATWVNLELHVRVAVDDTGRIALWQDGTLVGEASELPIVACPPNVTLGATSVASGLSPTPATLYVDDVVLSTARIDSSRD